MRRSLVNRVQNELKVTVDNFVRVETGRQFAASQAQAGGINLFRHRRTPVDILGGQQDVMRMNRDTLYSGCVTDIRSGAVLTVPDMGSRYMTVMIVNEDHYVNRVFHEPGEYELTVDDYQTTYVAAIARTFLADPLDTAEVAQVNALQDGLMMDAVSAVPYTPPVYSEASRAETCQILAGLAAEASLGMGCGTQRFGSKAACSEVKHLLGAAYGWGGLPSWEAVYQQGNDNTFGDHTMTIEGNVPVDGFWSISVYNGLGYFDIDNPMGQQGIGWNVNSATVQAEDATAEIPKYVINFSHEYREQKNWLYVPDMKVGPDGNEMMWTYTVRMYQPRATILQGTYKFPEAVPDQ